MSFLCMVKTGRPSERLSKKAQTLLAQLCVQHPMEGAVFELSAKLLDQEPLQKAQKLQKAYRAYTQVPITLLRFYEFIALLAAFQK